MVVASEVVEGRELRLFVHLSGGPFFESLAERESGAAGDCRHATEEKLTPEAVRPTR